MSRVGEQGDGRGIPSGVVPVASCMVSADEWLMLAPPPGINPSMLRRAAVAWLDSAPPPPGGSVAFVPVPSIDPVLGLAVLHRRPGVTAVYCGADDLGGTAAEIFSLTAAISTPVLLASARWHGPPRTRIISVGHGGWLHPSRGQSLDPSLHPVVSRVAPPQATTYACDCQVTPALADTLTALGSQHLRLWHDRRVT